MYLLDADTLIKANNLYYPMERFQPFWRWLVHHGQIGLIKIPIEQYEEITDGNDNLSEWLKAKDQAEKLLLPDELEVELVQKVTIEGYGDLNEVQIEKVGKDPFLIAHALADFQNRTVVTFENSAPSKQAQNRKIPDICEQFGIKCATLFDLIIALDFSTEWKPE